MYTITRQHYYYENKNCVEICRGSIDHTGPDALVQKYDGEFEEFSNPVEAVEAAIDICRQWRKDSKEEITLAWCEFDSTTFAAALRWSKNELELLGKCPRCGEIIEDLNEWFCAGLYDSDGFWPYDEDEKYCSEYCAGQHSEYVTDIDED